MHTLCINWDHVSVSQNTVLEVPSPLFISTTHSIYYSKQCYIIIYVCSSLLSLMFRETSCTFKECLDNHGGGVVTKTSL